MECDLEATIMSFYRACKVGEFETAFGVLHLVKDPRSSEYVLLILHWACKHKRLDVVKSLIEEYGLDPCMPFNLLPRHSPPIPDQPAHVRGDTFLHVSCRNESLKIVGYLTEHFDILNISNVRGELPLHIACAQQHTSLDMIKLVSNCDVNAKTNEGNTPLHIACRNDSAGSTEVIVQYLIHVKHADTFAQSNRNELPLHLACGMRSVEVVQLVTNCDINARTKQGDTPLHFACREGLLETVRYLVAKMQCSMSIQNCAGQLPLHVACTRDSLEIVKLVSNCDVNTTTCQGDTPLHFACREGLLETVRYLVEKMQCSMSIQNCAGQLPLHVACTRDSLEIVKLVSNCDVNTTTCQGYTPLHFACHKRFISLEIVRYLTERKQCNASIQNDAGLLPLHIACCQDSLKIVKLVSNCDVNVTTKQGDTPLHIACREGLLEIVRYLTEQKKCITSIQNYAGELPMHVACIQDSLAMVNLVSKGCNINTRTAQGNTPLHIACHEGSLEIVTYLITMLCDIGIPNNAGELPLHIACTQDLQIVKLVSDCFVNARTKRGDTPLHMACRKLQCSLGIVKYLIENKHCSVSIQNDAGKLPLHIACSRNSLEVVKLVSSCDVNARTKKGDTPLHVACRKGSLEIVKYLINVMQCDMSAINDAGQLLLHAACTQDSLEIVKLVSNCDVNAKTKQGDTPLHEACRQGSLEIVRYLVLEKQCTVSTQNAAGLFPLHLACAGVSLAMVKLVSNCDVNAKAVHSTNYSRKITIYTSKGDTPLHVACGHGMLEVVDFLIREKFCNLATKNVHNQSPIDVACSKGRFRLSEYNSPVQSLWLETFIHGACRSYCPNALIPLFSTNCRDVSGNTVLHIACKCHSVAMVKHLVENMLCDPCQINYYGDNVLHTACRHSCLETVDYLVKRKHCDPATQNYSGKLSLHIACQQQAIDMVKLVADCDPNTQTNTGNTPLHEAFRAKKSLFCAQKCEDVVRYLVGTKHCNVNCQNQEGKTPLQYACKRTASDIVKYLLSKGADPSIRDNRGQIPLMFMSLDKLGIIKALLKHGADPTPLYEAYHAYFKRHSSQSPPPTPLKVLFLGNSSTGKSTLIESLKCEGGEEPQGVDPYTAGIIPSDFFSKIYGRATFFDFAGQNEYYASHETILHDILASYPPIILLLVDISESEEDIQQKILYWLYFITNQCSSNQCCPHLIIVGSHADIVEARGTNPQQRIASVLKLVGSELVKSQMRFFTSVVVDCRIPESLGINKLRQCLQSSSIQLGGMTLVNFTCHCFLLFLLDKFRSHPVVTLDEIIACSEAWTAFKAEPWAIKEEMNEEDMNFDLSDTDSEGDESDPVGLLPTRPSEVTTLCEELGTRGHIIFLKNNKCLEKSWVILDKRTLLNEVAGAMFAPPTYKQNRSLASSTGVVPYSKLKTLFPQHDSTMVAGFLSYLEVCHEITDKEVLQLICEAPGHKSASERHLFFPGLVSIATPEGVWHKDESSNNYLQCGWVLRCSTVYQFFSPHFLQVLLLRLAFSFALPIPTEAANDHPAIQCQCALWKNGISWLDEDGIETMVEIEQNQAVVFMMRCTVDKQANTTHTIPSLRSSIIQKVTKTKEELCPQVATEEFFIDPAQLHYPIRLSQLSTLLTPVVQ